MVRRRRTFGATVAESSAEGDRNSCMGGGMILTEELREKSKFLKFEKFEKVPTTQR